MKDFQNLQGHDSSLFLGLRRRDIVHCIRDTKVSSTWSPKKTPRPMQKKARKKCSSENPPRSARSLLVFDVAVVGQPGNDMIDDANQLFDVRPLARLDLQTHPHDIPHGL